MCDAYFLPTLNPEDPLLEIESRNFSSGIRIGLGTNVQKSRIQVLALHVA